MLKTRLLHPEILAALGQAGHGAQVLIADGNYPVATRSAGTARHVYLNLAPGLVTVTDVLSVLIAAIPIEEAHVMTTDSGEEPPIFDDFRALLPETELQVHKRWDFYDMARGRDMALAIATGEQRTYASLLLTIGVVQPPPRLADRYSLSDAGPTTERGQLAPELAAAGVVLETESDGKKKDKKGK